MFSTEMRFFLSSWAEFVYLPGNLELQLPTICEQMVEFFLKNGLSISEMSNFLICAKSWSSIKDFGGSPQDNFIYFMKPNQILS